MAAISIVVEVVVVGVVEVVFVPVVESLVVLLSEK